MPLSTFLKQELNNSYLSSLKTDIMYLESVRKNGYSRETLIDVIRHNSEHSRNIALFHLISLLEPTKEVSPYHLNTHMMRDKSIGYVELFIEPYFEDAPSSYYLEWVELLENFKEDLLYAYSVVDGVSYTDIYITDPRGLYSHLR